MVRTILLLAVLFLSASIGKAGESPENKGPLYATLKTSMGDIVVQLFDDKAPKTVANFVGLASGAKEWTDPKTGEKVKRPLYNGTIFHRVIPGFMIQGGDPLGTGTGGPGYRFEDEFTPELRHDKAGILSMAMAASSSSRIEQHRNSMAATASSAKWSKAKTSSSRSPRCRAIFAIGRSKMWC